MIVPKSIVKGEKFLKLCVRCRLSKTKCDAVRTSPFPCSLCSRKNSVCKFEAPKPANRDLELTEKVVAEVQQMHSILDKALARKASLVESLIKKLSLPAPKSPLPSISEQMNFVLDTPTREPKDSLEPIYIDPIPTLSLANSFTIHSNHSTDPVSISYERAQALFKIHEAHFSKFLPVLPPSFFEKSLHEVHEESNLLFWSIIVTSMLHHGSADEYSRLAVHVQNLVVVNCWFNTPRSLYSLVALLILTTWPLPDTYSLQIQDSISVKYISLMKSLSMQFGLHKLNFIEEFSKKTKMDLDKKEDINNIVRERIYKYVNINSNYWLVYLGLSTSSYNGFNLDYIINRAANFDIFNQSEYSDQDNFINSLLKVSLVQLKMNESMNDSAENPNLASKLIQLNMFEQILNGYVNSSSPLLDDKFIALSLEYTKLQLYIYHLSKTDMCVFEYRSVIQRTSQSCEAVVTLFLELFGAEDLFFTAPIHYRFSIELAALLLLLIYKSPYLNSVKQYSKVKLLFQKAHGILTNNSNPEWKHLNGRLLTVISKYAQCDRAKLLAFFSSKKSFFLIDKMTNYLVSGLHYEMVWQIYLTEKKVSPETQIDWSLFGMKEGIPLHKALINHLLADESIFSKI